MGAMKIGGGGGGGGGREGECSSVFRALPYFTIQ